MARISLGVALALVALVLMACAPAAGQQAIVYLAAPQEIIGTLIQITPTIATPTGYDFLSVELVTEHSVTFVASATAGWQIVSALGGTTMQPLRVTISVFEQAAASSVAISVTPVSERRVMVERIMGELDRRFRQG